MNKLGNFLKRERENAGLNLRDFADRCEISHSHLANLEKGYDPRTGKPISLTMEMVKKIAKGTNTSETEIAQLAGLNIIELQGAKESSANYDTSKEQPSFAHLTPADQVDISDVSDNDIQFIQFMRRAGPKITPEQKRALMDLGKIFLKQSNELDEIEKNNKSNS